MDCNRRSKATTGRKIAGRGLRVAGSGSTREVWVEPKLSRSDCEPARKYIGLPRGPELKAEHEEAGDVLSFDLDPLGSGAVSAARGEPGIPQ